MTESATKTAGAQRWVWKAVGAPPPGLTAKAPSLLHKALIQFAIMALVGGLIYWKFPGHRLGSYIIWSLACAFLFCGLFIPAAYRSIDRFFFAVLPKWVATALNWLLLVPFFFVIFVPARLIQLLTGNDPMTRKVPTDLPTYWIPRKPVASLDQYKKQH